MAAHLRENLKKSSSSVVNYTRAAFFKFLIVTIAFVHFIIVGNWVHRWHSENANHPADWLPESFLIAPFQLLIASAFLALGRMWGNLIAFLISALLFFQLSFGALNGISKAHDRPMFSSFVIRYWLMTKYEYQPQELFQLGLAFVILSYAVFNTSRYWRRSRNLSHP